MNVSLRFGLLFALCLLAGCTTSKPDDGVRSQPGRDSLSNSASLGRDTVSSQGKGLVPARAKYLDSGSFNPDGYYTLIKDLRTGLTKDPITIDGRELGILELNIIEIDSADRKRLLQPPTAFLDVTMPNGDDAGRYPCAVAVVTPDSLSVRCPSTLVGEVSINGHFLVKSGDYSEKFGGQPATDLLVARVVISKGGKIAHDAVHRFIYFIGD
jgi:hypothetical protein